MAKIVTLHDNVTDEALYPKTIPDAVVDANGIPIASMVIAGGVSDSATVNAYIEEIYFKDSRNLTQIDLAIASLVASGEYAGKYLNVLRIRTSAGNQSVMSPLYYDTDSEALAAWESGFPRGRVVEYADMIISFADKGTASPVKQVVGLPTGKGYKSLPVSPNIKNYFQDDDIVESGTDIVDNILFNRYVKEIVYDTRSENTAYVKVFFGVAYYSDRYYNLIRIDEYDDNDQRVEAHELFKDGFDTKQEALSSVRSGLVNGKGYKILLSSVSFDDAVLINERANHPLTYDYAPRLRGMLLDADVQNLKIGVIAQSAIVVTPPYKVWYRQQLQKNSNYTLGVTLEEAVESDTTIFIRYYPEAVTTNLATLTIPAGDTEGAITFMPKQTSVHTIIVANGTDSVYATLSLKETETAHTFEKELKVLFVGSSYGVNTISMFPVLASKAGINITCGSLYYGSASIGLVDIRPLAHIPSKFANNSDFGWYKKFVNGSWEEGIGEEGSRTYLYALQDEQWDVIIFQRGAEELKLNSWSDMQTSCLQQMLDYTRAHCSYTPIILFADGIANPVGYNGVQTRNSQIQQTKNIIATSQVMREKFGIDVIPVSVAMQNARNTTLHNYGYNNGLDNHDLVSDTQHLDAGIGYYVTGATLFEYILKPMFGISIANLSYLPRVTDVKNCWVNSVFTPPLSEEQRRHTDEEMFTGITQNNLTIAKLAVMDAIATPTEISETIDDRWSRRYSVTQTLTGCTGSFQNSACETTFFSVITPDEDANISYVSVSMGGSDVTSSVYRTVTYGGVAFGVISIPNVTGSLVITITAG